MSVQNHHSVPTKLNLKYVKTETNPHRPLVRITPNPIQKTLTTITEDDTCSNNHTCDVQTQIGSSDVRLTCTAEVQVQYPYMKPEDIYNNDDKTSRHAYEAILGLRHVLSMF
jgi:hypothetical protein